MKLWVIAVYMAIESTLINSCKENPARGIKYDSTVSMMLCNSSLGSPHYITPRGKSPCHALNETQRAEQAAGSAACPVCSSYVPAGGHHQHEVASDGCPAVLMTCS